MGAEEVQPHAVDVEVATEAVAALFECPFCGCEHRVNIDWSCGMA